MPKYRRPPDQTRELYELKREVLNIGQDARGSALYSYTVTWDAESSSPSIGNGSLTGKYRRVGSMVLVNIRLVIGSSTSQGSGAWNFTPPFAVDSSSYWAGSCVGYNDSAGNWHSGNSMIEGGGSSAGLIVGIVGSGGSTGVVRLRAGTPVSWDTNSSIFISIWYGTTE